MKRERIYLAGRITANGWRNSIVNFSLSEKVDVVESIPVTQMKADWKAVLRNAGIIQDDLFGDCTSNRFPTAWPMLPRAVFGEHDYVGPFFVSCDHQCYHGSNTHGSRSSVADLYALEEKLHTELHAVCPNPYKTAHVASLHSSKKIMQLCTQAINIATLVFAWIEDKEAYGTIAELGYAYARGKTIVIAGPREPLPDLWFVYQMAESVIFDFDTPAQALRAYLKTYQMFESPIEEAFYNASQGRLKLQPQHKIGPYRVDFAVLHRMVVIELDGHEYHKTREQRTSDAQRQRYLEAHGWRVIRFTGSEVYKNPQACVDEAARLIEVIGGES